MLKSHLEFRHTATNVPHPSTALKSSAETQTISRPARRHRSNEALEEEHHPKKFDVQQSMLQIFKTKKVEFNSHTTIYNSGDRGTNNAFIYNQVPKKLVI